MRTSRRVLVSFGCVLLAVAVLCLLSLFSLVGTTTQRLWQLHKLAQIFPIDLLFALPGWLIALPFIITLKNAQGWRGWFILLIGTSIGPGFILTWGRIESPGRFTWQGDGYALVVSLIISFLTTVSYVLGLKFARRAIASVH